MRIMINFPQLHPRRLSFLLFMAKLLVYLYIFGDTVLSPTHLSSFPIHFHSVGLNHCHQQLLLILIGITSAETVLGARETQESQRVEFQALE